MNHPHPDELLLFAGGELAEVRLVEVAAHVTTCVACQDTLAQLDRALVALGTLPRRSRALRRPVVWAGFALGAAAVLTVVLIRKPAESSPPRVWMPITTWSANAGYVAGGKALVDIDAQLTRLEQESYYGRP